MSGSSHQLESSIRVHEYSVFASKLQVEDLSDSPIPNDTLIVQSSALPWNVLTVAIRADLVLSSCERLSAELIPEDLFVPLQRVSENQVGDLRQFLWEEEAACAEERRKTELVEDVACKTSTAGSIQEQVHSVLNSCTAVKSFLCLWL